MDGAAGSVASARQCVRQYFGELRDQLAAQESAALAVVDAHARERIAALTNSQHELATVAAQISAVCTQLEQDVHLDDARLLAQQPELSSLLDIVRKQQLEFTQMPGRLHVSLTDDNPRIPLMFTKDNRVHIGPNVEMRVVVLGLDGAGKTTILSRLKQNETGPTVPTIGFNVETLEYRNLKLTFWDVGGMPKLRPLWKHYYLNTQAVIYVIDSSDEERMPEAQSEFVKLLSENELRDAVLLVLANKHEPDGVKASNEQTQNCGGAATSSSDTVDRLCAALTLHKLCYGRAWQLFPCDARSGAGLHEALDWLAAQLLSHTVATPPAPSNAVNSITAGASRTNSRQQTPQPASQWNSY